MAKKKPTKKEIEVARFKGRTAQHPDECPEEYEGNEALHKAWQEGWDEQWRYRAVSYFVGRFYGRYNRNPKVGEAARHLLLTPEEIAAVSDDDKFLYRLDTDLPLEQQTLDIDGE